MWMAVLSDIRHAWLLEALLSKKALTTLKLSVQLLSNRLSDYSSPLWSRVIGRSINLIFIMHSSIVF